MQKLKDIIQKYYEGLAYLFFGGVATLLNLVVFAGFQAAFGTDFAAGIGNILDNCICILFAYWTNRTFVFKSANKGKAAWADFFANRYHRPSDDLSQPIDWEQAVRFVTVNYTIARAIADGDQRPVWNKGDFFGTLYRGPMAK